MAFAAEPGENQCALWEFETPTDSLTGELVRVTNDPLISSDIIFDLDTSDTIAVPGAVVTTSVSPTSLWGASLPASISANYFSLLKTDDNPITPLIDESDSWTVITPYTNLTFTVLVGFYFEAEMQGYAYHLVPSNPPATQAVLEPFTLSIRGWLPSDTTTTASDFSYCAGTQDNEDVEACKDVCMTIYEACYDDCSVRHDNPNDQERCYKGCTEDLNYCLQDCEDRYG